MSGCFGRGRWRSWLLFGWGAASCSSPALDTTRQPGIGSSGGDPPVLQVPVVPVGSLVPGGVATGGVGCGDGALASDEACDDGNVVSGDGCSGDCVIIEQGFECLLAGASCERRDVCGDAIVSGVETCDDGNEVGEDGCSVTCFVERDFICPEPGQPCTSTVQCGDGRVSGTETCDDGDTQAGDGCSGDCRNEPGYACPVPGFACEVQCGDGLVLGNEACDDFNQTSNDGCSASCTLEPGYACADPGQACHLTTCGDGVAEGSEPCDDGADATLGDGCSPGCRLEPDCSLGDCHSRCGDGLSLAGDAETCDDGNLRSGDGCSADCQLEPGFACAAETEAEDSTLTLPIVYRDFLGTGYGTVALTDGRSFVGHPDFDVQIAEVKNMVEVDLAPAGDTVNVPFKPVYNDAVLGTRPELVSSRASFNQWFSNDATVNMTFIDDLQLDPVAGAPGTFEFDAPAFFPLDGRGFSDPTLAEDGISTETLTGRCDAPDERHAYLFTSEVRYWFEYHGGEQLVFRGDDDVWVFIKNRLVVDLGGLHGAIGGDVCGNTFSPDFPADCPGLGPDTVDRSGVPLDLEEGLVYEIAVFQAERRACQSSYRLTLSGFSRQRSTCISNCGDGVVAGKERCDDGAQNGAGYGFCAADCQPGPRCGDAIVNGGEACDNGVNGDGYRLSDDACGPGCTAPNFCGDGQIDAAFGEDCDPGAATDATSTAAYGGCSAECRFGPRCGDGMLDPDEQCDDGNRRNNDGCNLSCKIERVVQQN